MDNNEENWGIYSDEYYDFLKCAYKRHYNQGEPWSSIKDDFNGIFSTNFTTSSVKGRVRTYVIKNKCVQKECANQHVNNKVQFNETDVKNTASKNEFVSIDGNGILTAQKIIECSQECFQDTNLMLKKLGYNPSQWEVLNMKISTWEQSSKKDGKNDLSAVSFRLKKRETLSNEDLIEAIKDVIKENIKPAKIEYEVRENKFLDNNKLMEICPIELHMGKLSNADETGENYDLKICKNIFNYIIQEVCKKQAYKKCGKALVVIGSDFFNSESDNMTTAKTPQENDTRYKKLFRTGLEMYTQALLTFRELFNSIEVRICSGNHARAMEFFLYAALEQYFRNDDIIRFIDDYKDTQAVKFGKCAIFYNHGDANLKRTIKSIPSEFYDIWGKTIYRELHLGHLHKEVTVDDEGGMITRRIGSPCATDAWHYTNRFVGATKKHQIFVWDAENGLEANEFININKSFFE